MTASVGETYQPPTYSCGDCFSEWIVERRVHTASVTKERRARWSTPAAAGATVDPHADAVTTALEALQNVPWR